MSRRTRRGAAAAGKEGLVGRERACEGRVEEEAPRTRQAQKEDLDADITEGITSIAAAPSCTREGSGNQRQQRSEKVDEVGGGRAHGGVHRRRSDTMSGRDVAAHVLGSAFGIGSCGRQPRPAHSARLHGRGWPGERGSAYGAFWSRPCRVRGAQWLQHSRFRNEGKRQHRRQWHRVISRPRNVLLRSAGERPFPRRPGAVQELPQRVRQNRRWRGSSGSHFLNRSPPGRDRIWGHRISPGRDPHRVCQSGVRWLCHLRQIRQPARRHDGLPQPGRRGSSRPRRGWTGTTDRNAARPLRRKLQRGGRPQHFHRPELPVRQ